MTLTELINKLNELKNDSKNADKQIYFFTFFALIELTSNHRINYGLGSLGSSRNL